MKAAAIVGAGPGIGAAVARRFAREGYQVALVAREGGRLEALAASLTRDGHRAKAYSADAADEAGLRAALAAIGNELGAPEVLVYNSAANSGQGLAGLAPEALVRDFRVSVAGALAATQAVLPGMRAAGQGTILFTGGGLALSPYFQYGSLSVGKAGIRSLAHSLAQELGPSNIHVATVTVAGGVAPGTPFDPDKIAEHYWRLHSQPKGAWEVEHLFKGE